MPDLRTTFSRFTRRLRESLTLREAEQRARVFTPEQSARLGQLYDAALERLRSARDLRDATRIGAASAIYREALLLGPRTLLFAWDPSRPVDSVGPDTAWQELEARLIAPQPDPRFVDRKGRRVRAFEDARALALQPDLLFLDRMRPVEALRQLDAAHDTLTRLLLTVEARSVRAIRRSRLLRFATLFLVLIGAVIGLVLWITSPDNVALHKPAQASSYWPGSPPADALVNGATESPWGSATQKGPDQWFQVDLLAEYRISRVVVFNRSDVSGRDSVPLAVEFSTDGKSFHEVGRFVGRATPAERWVLPGGGKPARYIRLKKLDLRGLALTEIEVYGSKH